MLASLSIPSVECLDTLSISGDFMNDVSFWHSAVSTVALLILVGTRVGLLDGLMTGADMGECIAKVVLCSTFLLVKSTGG